MKIILTVKCFDYQLGNDEYANFLSVFVFLAGFLLIIWQFRQIKNDLEHVIQIVFLSYTQPRKREASADFLIPAM